MKRPVIKMQLLRSFFNIVDIFSKEVSFVAKEITTLKQTNKESGLHRFAADLMSIHHFRCRLEEPLRDISLLDFELFDSEFGVQTLEHKSKVLIQLSDLEADIISFCQGELEQSLLVCMKNTLLEKSLNTEVSLKNKSHIYLATFCLYF